MTVASALSFVALVLLARVVFALGRDWFGTGRAWRPRPSSSPASRCSTSARARTWTSRSSRSCSPRCSSRHADRGPVGRCSRCSPPRDCCDRRRGCSRSSTSGGWRGTHAGSSRPSSSRWSHRPAGCCTTCWSPAIRCTPGSTPATSAQELNRDHGHRSRPRRRCRGASGRSCASRGCCAAAIGGVLALAWRRGERGVRIGVAAGVVAVVAFCILAAGGLPIRTRYLMLTACILAVFAGAGLFGWMTVADRRHRRWWAWLSAVALLAVLVTAPSQVDRIRSLRAALSHPGRDPGLARRGRRGRARASRTWSPTAGRSRSSPSGAT